MSNNQSQANFVIWISQTHFIQTKEMIYILFIIYSDFDAIRKSKRIWYNGDSNPSMDELNVSNV